MLPSTTLVLLYELVPLRDDMHKGAGNASALLQVISVTGSPGSAGEAMLP